MGRPGGPPLKFGHFAIARRAKTEQPMGSSPGKTSPNRLALKGRPSRDGLQRNSMLLFYWMSQSLAHLIVHAVFSTKDRRPLVHSEEIRIEIYVGIMPCTRPPFSGRFPGAGRSQGFSLAEALGCFVFALRAIGTQTRKCPDSMLSVMQDPRRPDQFGQMTQRSGSLVLFTAGER